MPAHSIVARDQQEIKSFVYKTLCEHEQLEVGVFPMTEKTLVRRRDPCGVYFCLHGPRSVKFWAIWETETNSILFYSSNGERFLKAHVTSDGIQES